MDHAKCEGMKNCARKWSQKFVYNFVLKSLLPLERGDVTILT